MKTTALALLVTGSIFSSSIYALPPSFTGSITLGHNNNLGLGNYYRDMVSDSYQDFSAGIGKSLELTRNTRLSLNANVNLETYTNFDGLNNNTINFKAAYLFQFSNRFRSPQYSLYFLTGQSDFKSDLRDQVHSQTGLSINWRYDDRTLFRGGISTEIIDADSTNNGLYETFDSTRNTTYFGINISQTKRLSLYASINMISGDITANWTTQTLDEYEISFPNIRPAWDTIPDTIFGAGRESTKYNATITQLALGLNYSFSQNNAIDIVFESLDANSGVYSYTVEKILLSYLHKF